MDKDSLKIMEAYQMHPQLPKKEYIQTLINSAKDLVRAKEKGNTEAIGYLIDELKDTLQKLGNL